MNKDKVMTFRVSPKEYELIKKRCEKNGYQKTFYDMVCATRIHFWLH